MPKLDEELEQDFQLARVCLSCAERPPEFNVEGVGGMCQHCLANDGSLTVEQLETAEDFDPAVH